jgi:hypothetical protein
MTQDEYGGWTLMTRSTGEGLKFLFVSALLLLVILLWHHLVELRRAYDQLLDDAGKLVEYVVVIEQRTLELKEDIKGGTR